MAIFKNKENIVLLQRVYFLSKTMLALSICKNVGMRREEKIFGCCDRITVLCWVVPAVKRNVNIKANKNFLTIIYEKIDVQKWKKRTLCAYTAVILKVLVKTTQNMIICHLLNRYLILIVYFYFIFFMAVVLYS